MKRKKSISIYTAIHIERNEEEFEEEKKKYSVAVASGRSIVSFSYMHIESFSVEFFRSFE